jgi:hypothetical protein
MHGLINVKSPNNISKWQMEFNSAFKGLKLPLRVTNSADLWNQPKATYISTTSYSFQKTSINQPQRPATLVVRVLAKIQILKLNNQSL